MSRYIGNPFNNVLILLREPNSSGESVSIFDNEWIIKVLNGKEAKNASKYRKSFISMLEFVGMEERDLPHIAFDNIKPNGGLSHVSSEYYRISSQEKGKIALKIINEIKPKIIFTCSDIYDAIRGELTSVGHSYKESLGIEYRRGQKRIFAAEYKGNTISMFEIYHPCLGWIISNRPFSKQKSITDCNKSVMPF